MSHDEQERMTPGGGGVVVRNSDGREVARFRLGEVIRIPSPLTFEQVAELPEGKHCTCDGEFCGAWDECRQYRER